uniref:Serine/threonine-protein kinase ULK3 n=1 Tax=Acrobeloides nanus TaxID=290746 RepID=A0A914E0F0_9BILA
MEFCGGGHLGAFIQQNRSLSEELSQDIFHQLSLALSYMWKRHITHMDLKPQNILIANRMKMCIKVADFGLSQLMTDEGQTAFRGSPLYMAPEIYTIQKYDGTVDLWSAGVILYECIFGRAPFSSDSMEQVISQLLSPDPIEIPQAQISYECRDLLGRLLIRDPQQRINFENFFAHPFVAIDILAEDRNLAQARKLVNQASVDEQLGDLSSTSQLLQEAVELYLKCLDESENNSEKKALRQKINEYLTKAETVKKRLGNSSCGLSKTAIQTRSRTRNDKSSINDQPYTSALKNLRLGSDIVSRSQSLIRQARKAWSNSDGKTALSKYSEAIEIALESARQETTSAEMKNQLREKVSKWLSEAEEIKD